MGHATALGGLGLRRMSAGEIGMRLAQSLRIAVLMIAVGLFVSIGSSSTFAGSPPASASAPAPNSDYALGRGDKLRVIVFGEDDLGGEYVVDGSGFVRLPLIGQVKAAGLSLHDFEIQIQNQLNDGYLKDARVNVEITNYRPFYIIGEGGKP